MKDISIKLIKVLALPFVLAFGLLAGFIGFIYVWYWWTFKPELFYTKLTNYEKGN